jgi:protein-L-isoaspartate O-methyltransferase
MAVSVFGPSIGAQDGMFSAADAYERFMGRWSRELAPLLVRFAGVRDGDAVLDVGSGTGALTAAVVAAAPSSRVIGIDSAAPYVEFARTRDPGDLVRFEVGDAQRLRFGDGGFDRTLSLLVLNFIPNRAKALVTRPDGTVAAAVWDYGQGMQMLRVFWDEAIALNPALDARDERHMPLCRKGNLRRSGANMGCRMCWKTRSRSRRGSVRSMTTGCRSRKSRVRPASMSRRSPPMSATSFDCGYAGGCSATALIAQSSLQLVRGPCGESSPDVLLR